jgi:hypothetical protein
MGNFIFELKGVAVTPRIKAFVNELKLKVVVMRLIDDN